MIALAMGWSVMFSQSHLPGEFIVMFHDHQNAQKWGSEVGLEHVESLSPRAHIHLYRLPSSSTPAQDWQVLRSLRNDERIEAVQFNHEVQNRETLLMIPKSPSNGIT